MYRDEIKSPRDLNEFTGSELLGVFNEATGKATKKFASRAKGLEQTWRAISEKRNGATPKKKVKTVSDLHKAQTRSKPGLTFRLQRNPEREMSPPRASSTRFLAYEVIKNGDGSFAAIQKATGWSQKDAYEGVRLLALHNGHNLWSETKDGDINIRFLTDAAFDKALAALNG